MTTKTDPFQWLETVESERVLAWVGQQNQRTQAAFTATASFQRLQQDLRAIFDADDRIPWVQQWGEYYYNFWKDAQHPRGLWRRTSLASYRQAEPQWETVLDLDELSAAENEAWVWASATALPPHYQRCLIALSRGGADATVTREFDLQQKCFVADGFYRPEAKGSLSWIDQDNVYVATDFGAGSLTRAGYPREVRQWQRGTALRQAKLVFAGQSHDLSVRAYRDHTPGFERDFVYRASAFYENELYLRARAGKLQLIPTPNDAKKSVHWDWLFLELRSDMRHKSHTYRQGSLLAAPLQTVLAGQADYHVLFTPDAHTALDEFSFTQDYLILNVLKDVQNQLSIWSLRDQHWQQHAFIGAPECGTLTVSAADPYSSNAYFLSATDFLTPTRLYYGDLDHATAPQCLKQMPAFFDASRFQVSQHFARSADGTRIPYFQIAPKTLQLDGDNPTLMFGYGGFEVSLYPGYNPVAGRAWLDEGGVYVVANIRGGGEYGSAWHQAARKAKRHKAYEDFAAVAQDLIQRQVTRPQRLGMKGGSNGGLLAGNMLVKYPELWGAIVSKVPLLDMRRYHLLLAGASWMAEYGDPDSADWDYLQHYSPYHNLQPQQTSPPILFTSSTRDDRVHPAHARKMYALMRQQGHAAWYYENIEGGHGGAANNEQAAYMTALAYHFLKTQLFGKVREWWQE